jgi:hypothetical protein
MVTYQPRSLLWCDSKRINTQNPGQKLRQLDRALPTPHLLPFRHDPLNIRAEILQLLRPRQDLFKNVAPCEVDTVVCQRVVSSFEHAKCDERFAVSSFHFVALAIFW